MPPLRSTERQSSRTIRRLVSLLMMACGRVFDLADTPLPRSAMILTQAGTDVTGEPQRQHAADERERNAGQDRSPCRIEDHRCKAATFLSSGWKVSGISTGVLVQSRGRIITRPLRRDQSIVRARCGRKLWVRRRQGGGQWAPNMGLVITHSIH